MIIYLVLKDHNSPQVVASLVEVVIILDRKLERPCGGKVTPLFGVILTLLLVAHAVNVR